MRKGFLRCDRSVWEITCDERQQQQRWRRTRRGRLQIWQWRPRGYGSFSADQGAYCPSWGVRQYVCNYQILDAHALVQISLFPCSFREHLAKYWIGISPFGKFWICPWIIYRLTPPLYKKGSVAPDLWEYSGCACHPITVTDPGERQWQ